jgi:hypothetical protein
VGWILLHDPAKVLSTHTPGDDSSSNGITVKQGLHKLTQLIVGSNTLCQAVIPTLFPLPKAPTPCSPSRSRSGSTTSTEDDDNEGAAATATATATAADTDMDNNNDDAARAAALAAYRRQYVGTLEGNARFFVAALAGDARFAGRVSCSMPQGAMYAMLRLEKGGLRAGLDGDDVAFCAKLLAEENVVLLPGQAFGVAGYVRVVLAPPREMLAQALARLAAFVERYAA